jgi:hypothetical protein
MYRDLISYKLAENITEEHLVKVAKQVVDNWMKKQPGFISWEININSTGSYTDIVTWQNKEVAKASEKKMGNIPNATEWFACYEKGSISSTNLTSITEF